MLFAESWLRSAEDSIARRNKSAIDDGLIDKLLEDHEHGAAPARLQRPVGELNKRPAERMLSVTRGVHLDDEGQ